MASNQHYPDSESALRQATQLLQSESPDALAYFDVALSAIRAAQDRRREVILLLNYLPLLLEKGTVERAVQLAQHAVELAERGSLGQQVLAQLRLGDVWQLGAQQPELARAAFERALELLGRVEAADIQALQMLIDQLRPALMEAAQTASQIDYQLALRFMERFDPALAAQIRNSAPKTEPPLQRAADLQSLSYERLDDVIAAWRTRTPVTGGARRPTVLGSMRSFADTVKWNEAVEYIDGIAATFTPGAASADGAGAFFNLAQQLVDGGVSWSDARLLVAQLNIADQDLACVCLYALADRELFSQGVGTALLTLAADKPADAALAGRLHRLDGTFATFRGDARHAARAYQRGAQRLAGGENDALRAELFNETSLALTQMGEHDQALQIALQARDLARASNQRSLAFMAEGNRGFVLMQLRRYEEALAVFTALQQDQLAVNDTAGAEQTEFNIAACRQNLGIADAGFSETSDDPDAVFAVAQTAALRHEYDRAIPLFERVFQLADAAKVYWQGRGRAHEIFARALFDAKDLPRAIEQMKAAAAEFERTGNRRELQAAQQWLGRVSNIPALSLKYAEEALQSARAQKDAQQLAEALTNIGVARALSGELSAAVEALEEAYSLSQSNEVRNPFAEALLNARQPERAYQIYSEMLADGERTRTAKVRVLALMGLSACLDALNRGPEAVGPLRQAQQIALSREVDDTIRLESFNRLGMRLVMLGDLAEGIELLEEGIRQARSGGYATNERHMLLNFGNALKELGDIEGARQAMTTVREQSRQNADAAQEALAVFALANLDQQTRRFEAARAGYLEAAALARQVNNLELLGAVLDSTGVIESHLGHPERAIDYHREALSTHERVKARKAQAIDGINLTGAYTLIGDETAARATLSTSQQLITTHGLDFLHGSAELAAGQMEARFGEWVAAAQHFRSALLAIEAERNALSSPAQQREWSEQRTHYYSIAGDAAIAAGDGATAIEFLESNRTRFLQALVTRRQARPAADDELAFRAYERAADRIAELRRERRNQLAHGEALDEQEFLQAQAELSAATAKLPVSPPQAVPELPNWTQLQEAIPPGAAAWWFHVGDSGVHFVLGGRTLEGAAWTRTGHEPGFTTKELHELVIGDLPRLETALQQGDDITPLLSWVVGSMVPDFAPLWNDVVQRTCRDLGERFWPALLVHVPDHVQELILLPGAGFNVLPLHAARFRDGSLLTDRYQVRYAPSLNLLLDAVRNTTPLPAALQLGQAVNPTEDDTLPFSIAEAHESARHFTGQRLPPLNGRRARSGALLELLQRADLLHFAGHGYYDPEDPLRSGILCASPAGQPVSNGELLSLGSILDSADVIRCRVAILSACDTGRIEPTDLRNDYLGLPGGFLTAGVTTVIATLWRVDDLATALLITKFFEEWQPATESASAALSRAQHWLRSELTVQQVVEQLEAWLALGAADLSVLDDQLDAWRALAPVQLAFPGEEFWAAFHVSGLGRPWS